MANSAAFKRAARRYGHLADREAAKYGISGAALLTKLAKGESGFSMHRTSSAGAKGGTQFMPATRAEFIRRYGVDAWKDPDSAVHAAAIYLRKSGLAAYNPGMKSYPQYILGQKVGGVGKGAKGGSKDQLVMTSGGKGATLDIKGKVTPAQEVPSMRAAALQTLAGGHGLPHLGKRSKLREAYELFRTGQATETQPTSYSQTTKMTPGSLPTTGTIPGDGGSKGGKVTIVGGNPGRLTRPVVAFAKQLAGRAGPLKIDSGATHSKYTVNGNVSAHWTGNATDIPATGKRLLHLGQQALINAGMPESKARKQTGGLYNVGHWQIIFLTNEGGNHYNHLHVGRRSA